MRYDVWFCRYEGKLLYAVVSHGNEPDYPREAGSVKRVLDAIKSNAHEIASVGILPPEYLGLE